MAIHQITKMDEYDTVSDGTINCNGCLKSRFRPLTLENKKIAEGMRWYYKQLDEIAGSRGFNWPDISRYFNDLTLRAIDAKVEQAREDQWKKAKEFVEKAKDHEKVIHGVKLFRGK